jgi:hypothetical protein
MSTPEVGENAATGPSLFRARATQLLKEYSAKLHSIVSEGTPLEDMTMRVLWEQGRKYQRLRDYFRHLVAPCEELARQVSGMLEQGKLDPLDRVELWLSLSEFENELTQGKTLFGVAQTEPTSLPLKKS